MYRIRTGGSSEGCTKYEITDKEEGAHKRLSSEILDMLIGISLRFGKDKRKTYGIKFS